MPQSSYVDLLKAGKLPRNGLFLLQGDDASVHQDVVSRLVRGLVVEPDLNYLHVRAAEAPRWDDIEAFSEEFPMMSPRRLLWLDGIDKYSPAVRQALASYLPRRPESTVLVLSSGSGSGRRSETASPEDVAAQTGLVVLCDIRVPDVFGRGPDDRPAWVTLELQRRALTATPATRQALALRLYGSLADMRNEVDKLAAYSGERTEVTTADIDAVISRPAQGTLQQMSGLLQSRKAEGALRLYRELLRTGMSPFQVLSYLGAIVRKTATTAELRHLVEAEVMAKTGVPPEVAVELFLLQYCQGFPITHPLQLRPRR